ncbi:hypothetical protein M9H77_36304 [Catharanthus roseus]|uniref:Uncharacterized protein n=1 Tax=Catharanthus roseus TaxID=4058 RepID=A0ACB9ZRG4_CATRO|nr:hypothetical protein M9H77_36304 [Catharanthus roseus]
MSDCAFSEIPRLSGYGQFSCDHLEPLGEFFRASQREKMWPICPQKKQKAGNVWYWIEVFTFPVPGMSTIMH